MPLQAGTEAGFVAQLALPDDEDVPAQFSEVALVATIPGPVGREFGVPEGGPGLRADAAVPAGVGVPGCRGHPRAR